MARKRLIRQLPPLAAKPSFKPRENKSARLLEILRGIALRKQRDQPQVFYAVRDVARRFSLPTSTVARVYDQLEAEGILVGLAGSRTLLQGLKSGRRLSVLGVIGMPADTRLFVTLQGYRVFCIRSRRELRARGFAVTTLFFDQRDIKTGRLISRIDSYNIDTLLWYQPGRDAREIVAQLNDSGVRIVGVSDGGVEGIRCRYEVQRELAIRDILREWRLRHGIESVTVVRGTKPQGAMEETLQTLAEEQRLASFEFKAVGGARLGDFLESLPKGKRAGIVFPSFAASFFAFRAPEALMKLMSQSRVALTGGAESVAYAQVPDVHADLVVVDWQLVAERIVSDLINKSAFDRGKIDVFKAQAYLQAPLSHYAESL